MANILAARSAEARINGGALLQDATTGQASSRLSVIFVIRNGPWTWSVPASGTNRILDGFMRMQKHGGHLEQIASGYPSRERFLTQLRLDPPDATSDRAGVPRLDEDYLILSTIHSDRGREWKSVYLLNVVDGCMPFGRTGWPVVAAGTAARSANQGPKVDICARMRGMQR
jgi:superfamily I DNA/RNA helicase